MSGQIYGLFNDSYPPVMDGVTMTVDNYCRWLGAAGKEVCVVTPWGSGQTPRHGARLLRYFSLPIYNRHPYRYGYPLLDPFIWRKLAHTPFRLIHSHSPFSAGKLAAYAARHHDVPLVATFHSKYRTDLERSLPGPMVEYQMRKLLRFYSSATEVWIPQGAVEETLREYGYKGPVRVVENGNDFADGIPDIEAYRLEARAMLHAVPGEMRLIFVGQQILEKGVDIIVRALGQLKGRIPFSADFIGTGYALDDMKHLATGLGVADRVRFHGMVADRELIRRHYAAADLFLFPSFYDNAPLVVREAAAVMTPSLLLEGSTAAEMIHDGENGFLTRRTPEAYAETIAGLWHQPERLTHAGEGARATLCRPWRDVVDEVQGLYNEIISRYGRH